MNKRSFIGIHLLLLVIAGLLSYVVYHQYENSNKKVWPNDYIRFLHLVETHPMEEPVFDRSLSLDKPHMEEPYVAAWAARAVSETMTFGYDNYKDRMKRVAKYYTDNGMKSLLNTRGGDEDAYMDHIERNEFIFVSEPIYDSKLNKPYTLVSKGVVNGVYQWVFKIQVRQLLRNRLNNNYGHYYQTVKVIRTADRKYRWGMVIDEYIQ